MVKVKEWNDSAVFFFEIAMDKLKGIDFRALKHDEAMQQLAMENDKRAQDVCASLRRFIHEQNDTRMIVEKLARRIDAMRDGTHRRDVSSGSNAPNEQNSPDLRPHPSCKQPFMIKSLFSLIVSHSVSGFVSHFRHPIWAPQTGLTQRCHNKCLWSFLPKPTGLRDCSQPEIKARWLCSCGPPAFASRKLIVSKRWLLQSPTCLVSRL